MSEQTRLHVLLLQVLAIAASLIVGLAVAVGSDDNSVGVAWWGWLAAAIAGIAASARRRLRRRSERDAVT